jgi:hypothetical protein
MQPKIMTINLRSARTGGRQARVADGTELRTGHRPGQPVRLAGPDAPGGSAAAREPAVRKAAAASAGAALDGAGQQVPRGAVSAGQVRSCGG